MNTYCVRNSSVLLGLFKSGILMSLPFKMYIPVSTFICPGLALFLFLNSRFINVQFVYHVNHLFKVYKAMVLLVVY